MILLSLRGSCLRVYGSGLACVGRMKKVRDPQLRNACSLSLPPVRRQERKEEMNV